MKRILGLSVAVIGGILVTFSLLHNWPLLVGAILIAMGWKDWMAK